MKAISNVSLQQIIKNNNIPTCQTDLIYEIFNASKVKNPKNRRLRRELDAIVFVISDQVYNILCK